MVQNYDTNTSYFPQILGSHMIQAGLPPKEHRPLVNFNNQFTQENENGLSKVNNITEEQGKELTLSAWPQL